MRQAAHPETETAVAPTYPRRAIATLLLAGVPAPGAAAMNLSPRLISPDKRGEDVDQTLSQLFGTAG